MGSLFNVDNPLFTFMGKLWDLICVSLVWFVLCIYCLAAMVSFFPNTESSWVFPITLILQMVTIGPATTALYYTVVKVIRKERGYALRSFIHSFKLNFKQGAIAGELILAAILILYVDFQYADYLADNNSSWGQVFYVGCLTLSIILFAVTVFIFPVLSRFTLKTIGLFRTSFLISMRHIFTTILLIIIVAAFALLVEFFPPAIMIVPSICILTMSFLIERVFKKYMPKDENAEETGKDQWYFD